MTVTVLAQCPVADFTLPANACQSEDVRPLFTPTAEIGSYYWDACDGALSGTPALSHARTMAAAVDALDIKSVDEGSRHFAFIVSRGGSNSSNLLRVELTADLSDTLSVSDIGSLNPFVKPTGIALHEEGSQKYALIAYNDQRFMLASFGNSWSNTPSGSAVPGLTALSGQAFLTNVAISKIKGRIVAFCGNAGYNELLMIDFGSSIANTPTLRKITGLGTSGDFKGVDVIRSCNSTFVVLADNGKGVFVVNFGTDIDAVPSPTMVSNQKLYGIAIAMESDHFIVMGTSNAGLVRIDLGTDIENTSPTETVLGTFGIMTSPYGFALHRSGSKFTGLVINNGDSNLGIIDFPKPCNLTGDYANTASPAFTYTAAGTFPVTLYAQDTAGNRYSVQKSIAISSFTAPDISLAATPACTGQSSVFTGTNTSADISTWAWDFGDGQTASTAGTASHTYATKGDYTISLTVTAANGCTNHDAVQAHIYTRPVADFSLPVAVFCTGQDYVFVNNATVDADMSVSWQWSVNGVTEGTAADFTRQFPAPLATPTDIDLNILTPVSGCDVHLTKTIASVFTGPAVDFSVTGSCLGDQFQFNNLTTGAVTSYQWSFSDGVTSHTADTTRVFASAASYTATLLATNAQGCENQKSASVVVHALPQPAFSADAPPSACTGTDTQFHDLTPALSDSNPITWTWTWDDGTTPVSAGQTPTHVYANAATYNVTLDVITDAGCSGSVTLPIDIKAAPVAAFTPSSICAGQSALFTDGSTGAIDWAWLIDGNSYTGSTASHLFATSGSYSARLIVTDANACQDTLTQSVTVATPPSPAFSASIACANQSTTFTDQSVAGAEGIASLTWSFSDGGNGAGTSIAHAFASAASYQATLSVMTNTGCTYTLTQPVTVFDTPVADFVALPSQGVAPLLVNFQNNSSGATTYAWQFGDQTNAVSSDPAPAFTYAQIGDFQAQLTATNADGCSDIATAVITATVSPLCPSADFVLTTNFCLNQNVQPQYQPAGDVASFRWDFCDGSLNTTPQLKVSRALPAAFDALDIKSVTESGREFSFVISRGGSASSNLVRIEWSSDFADTLSTHDLGAPNPYVKPTGLALWTEGQQKYALIADNGQDIVLATFGTSWLNQPVMSLVPGLSVLKNAANLRHLRVSRVGKNVVAFVNNAGYDQVLVLDFGNSITATPVLSSVLVPAGGVLNGIDVIQSCGNTYVVASDYIKGLYVLNFGSDITAAPGLTQISNQTNLVGLSAEMNQGNFYVWATSDNAGLHRFNLGASMENTSPVHDVMGTFGVLNSANGFYLHRTGSSYFGMFINNGDNEVAVIEFPKPCSIRNDYSGQSTPVVTYAAAGTYLVSLHVQDTLGNVFSKTRSVTVTGANSPDIDFASTPGCSGLNSTFSAANVSGDLTTYAWDFGDGNTGQNLPNDAHVFALRGDYSVTLTVTAVNGCQNAIRHDVHIYTQPVADFALPGAVFCTAQDYQFLNTSVFDSDMPIGWEWSVNGIVMGSDPDLIQNFSTATAANTDIQLKLLTPVSGCATSVTRPISEINVGPAVDFTVNGTCSQKPFTFTNQTVGAVISYHWDFSDQVTSSQPDTVRTFDQPGNYDVTLVATNAAGCVNSRMRTVTVYTMPQPDFTLDLPPFSCAGSDAQFRDATALPTDSNITAWAWQFGDATNQTGSGRLPTHRYDVAGDYTVSLSVITNVGCAAQMSKAITIAPTPIANFSVAGACANQSAHFTDLSGGNIATWQWSVGSSQYTLQHPSHVFALPGKYLVNLVVTSTGGCVGAVNQEVVVPDVPLVQFSSTLACAGQLATFTDLTSSNADPVEVRQWQFSDGGSATGDIVNYAFNTAGTWDATLSAQTQAGCRYQLSRKVTVHDTPHAAFSVDIDAGGPPLTVNTVNESTGSSSNAWSWGDGAATTSTEESPSFAYTDLGDYLLQLRVENTAGCADSASTVIHVVVPRLDIVLSNLHLVTNAATGTAAAVFDLTNNSNIRLQNIQVKADLSGKNTVSNQLTLNLQPGETTVASLPYDLITNQLRYLCVQAVLEKDIAESDNQNCLDLGDSPYVSSPFPNPASSAIRVQVITAAATTVNTTIWRSDGTLIFRQENTALGEGLNELAWDVTGWASGMYQIQFSGPFGDQRFTVVVVH
ncbi:MAG: PKD domain-containing protein [Cyclobacteriaceae bacterium]